MVEIGQLVLKTAGRDSGEIGIVIEKLDDTYVVVDGNLRKKKCNIKHLETLNKKVDLKKNASSETIRKELEKLGIKLNKKGKKRDSKPRPRRKRKIKKHEPKEPKSNKEIKKEVKKEKKEKKKEVEDRQKNKPKPKPKPK